MWYGADVVEMLLLRDSGHEIGFHDHTHRTFDRLSEDASRFKFQEWLRLAARKAIVPQTVVFPQGRVGRLDPFRKAGFICYRGAEAKRPALAIPLLGKVLNKINPKLGIFTPQVFEATVDSLGLVNVPGSLWLFRTNRRVEMILDALNLHTLRLQPIVKSIARAAEEKKVIHLWVHPQKFRTERDFASCALCSSASPSRRSLESFSQSPWRIWHDRLSLPCRWKAAPLQYEAQTEGYDGSG